MAAITVMVRKKRVGQLSLSFSNAILRIKTPVSQCGRELNTTP
tara:strand:+ start:1716 stop:1844 length:129 start_codon:yes stop_codon:yes gene_type:complete